MENAFNTFKSSSAARKAADKYREIPFLQMLDDAKNGDKEAFLYIILNSIGPIYKVFTSYFVVGRNLKGTAISDVSHDFFNELLVYLYKLTDRQAGPLFRFNPEAFVQTDDDFLINKLRYYIYRYAQVLAKKVQGDTTKTKNTEVSAPVVGDGSTDFFDTIEAPVSKESPLGNQQEFVKWLTLSKPRLAQMLIMLDDNAPQKLIMSELGINSRQSYHKMIDALTSYYNKFLKSRAE